jgi:hypothetical protein
MDETAYLYDALAHLEQDPIDWVPPPPNRASYPATTSYNTTGIAPQSSQRAPSPILAIDPALLAVSEPESQHRPILNNQAHSAKTVNKVSRKKQASIVTVVAPSSQDGVPVSVRPRATRFTARQEVDTSTISSQTQSIIDENLRAKNTQKQYEGHIKRAIEWLDVYQANRKPGDDDLEGAFTFLSDRSALAIRLYIGHRAGTATKPGVKSKTIESIRSAMKAYFQKQFGTTCYVSLIFTENI